MNGSWKQFATGLAAAALLATGAPALGQETSIKGVIIRHSESTIVVRGSGGGRHILLASGNRQATVFGELSPQLIRPGGWFNRACDQPLHHQVRVLAAPQRK